MFFPPQTAVGIDAEKRTLGRTRALALTGVIGPLWFATLVVVQGFLLPDYSHVRMPISALAAILVFASAELGFVTFSRRMKADALATPGDLHDVDGHRRAHLVRHARFPCHR